MTRLAAQYVRMSTDDQIGSIEIQKAAIARYADAHGLRIVASYEDEGRSGMTLRYRDAMQKLLRDVMNADCGFDTVLVLDVSRWGRFQDVDESAYHEYHCRKNGVQVVYVAESFSGSQAPLDGLVKQMKRVMAAEYSRELGVKVRAGQERVLRLGCIPAGSPPLGYRRLAVGFDGQPKRLLGSSERKPQLTDRIQWVPGPDVDVALIRRIFALYTESQLTTREIATCLRSDGEKMRNGMAFNVRRVRSILRSAVYRGDFTFRARSVSGRGSTGKRTPIECVGHVPPLIDENTWARAAARLKHKEKTPQTETHEAHIAAYSREQMLSTLRRAVRLNPAFRAVDLVAAGLPNLQTFRRHFGPLLAAYTEIGHFMSPREGAWRTRRLEGTQTTRKFIQDVNELLNAGGVPCVMDSRRMTLHLVDFGLTVRTKVARPAAPSGPGWRVTIKPWDDEWLLLMRQDGDGTGRDFYLLPPLLSRALTEWITEAAFESLRDFRVVDASDIVSQMRDLPSRSFVAGRFRA